MNDRTILHLFGFAFLLVALMSSITTAEIRASQAVERNNQPPESEFSPSALSPTNRKANPPLPGLTLWLTADAGVTLDGSQVAAWADQSGSGLVISQSDTSQQPSFIPLGVCTNPTIKFDGNDVLFKDSVSGTSLFSDTTSTVFLLLKQSPNDHHNTYLAWLDSNLEGFNRFLIQENRSDNTIHFQVGDPNPPNGGDLWALAPSTWEGHWNVLTVSRDGNDGAIRVNGVSLPLLAQFFTPGNSAAIGNLWIGSDTWMNYYQGEIAEIIVYNTSLSDEEIESIEDMLMDKVLCDNHAYRIYCPLITKPCLPLYSDDFSNPASGWPAEDTDDILYEYNNGEYRILVRPDQWGAIAHPGFQSSDYVVSVNLRNPNGVYGSYGIAFGLAGDFSTFYTLEIYPDGWYGIYRWDPNDIVTLSEAYSPAIYQGSATNSIKVERNGASIKAYANGQLLASVTDGTYTGSRYIGLAVFSYDQPNVDIRFDNFTVYSIDCGTVNSASGTTNGSQASPGERFFDFNLLERGHIQPQR